MNLVKKKHFGGRLKHFGENEAPWPKYGIFASKLSEKRDSMETYPFEDLVNAQPMPSVAPFEHGFYQLADVLYGHRTLFRLPAMISMHCRL